MSRFIALSLSLVTVIWMPSLLAEADGPDFYAVQGVAADDVLNLRAGPSAKAEKVGGIPHDARGLRNLGCQGIPSYRDWQEMTPRQRAESGKNRWCKVQYQGLEGWVAGRFLREDNAPAAGDDPRPSSALPKGFGDTPYPGVYQGKLPPPTAARMKPAEH